LSELYEDGVCPPKHNGAKITAIGEAPSHCEVGTCDCPRGIHPFEGFVGPAGKIMDIGLMIGGLSRSNINVTNICKRKLIHNNFKLLYDRIKIGRKVVVTESDELKRWKDLLKRSIVPTLY